MFIHTVFFWLKEKDNDDARTALHEGLKELSEISGIQAGYVGTPASTRRAVIDHTYDFSITFMFPDKATQDDYQVHPDHLKFVDKCAGLWGEVKVYDMVTSD
ncbi:Dabb family protein [Persicitalea sp.]|uniref:Dabb family protein n=1 Tax=Persicitalea sp. TaxID=3100273 RepID=UPI0035946E3B